MIRIISIKNVVLLEIKKLPRVIKYYGTYKINTGVIPFNMKMKRINGEVNFVAPIPNRVYQDIIKDQVKLQEKKFNKK